MPYETNLTKASDATLPTLLVLLGSTGVGKTTLSIELAEFFGTSIVSADSRQIYRELPIGTAAPSENELKRIPHYMVGTHSIQQPYSAGDYENQALEYISQIHSITPIAILSGGSMMYIDAVCRGIDAIPDVRPEIRTMVYQRYEAEGLDSILKELKDLDPEYYNRVDHRNYKRVLHGYEVCISSGAPFSSYHTGLSKVRPFRIIKLGLNRPRQELYQRINQRVLDMIKQGLIEEARTVYPHRNLNALNTVGYKELFRYFDGSISLSQAIGQIQKNSRVYARKQQTWWQRDNEIHWIEPKLEEVLSLLKKLGIGAK